MSVLGPLLAVMGGLVLLVGLSDMASTTIVATGNGGPVTSWSSHAVWRLLRAIARRRDRPERTLRRAGLTVVLTIVLTWVALVWAGWWLVFSASEGAVIEASTGRPASVVARGYFAGFTVFALGIGDYVPARGVWQLLTALSAFTGLAVVTMGITFLVPVTSGVIERRSLALDIRTLGEDPYEIVRNGWDGDGFRSGFADELRTLAPRVTNLGQRHLAYPVLHYFHAADVRASAAAAIPMLDEALSLLERGVAPEARPRNSTLRTARKAVSSFVGAMTDAFIGPCEDAPSVPSLEPLREAGIPTVEPPEWRSVCGELEPRRRALCGLVEADGRSWSELWTTPPTGTAPGLPEDRQITAG